MENTLLQTETYKGYEIEIHHSEYDGNPYEENDGNVPLIYKSDGTTKDYSNGQIINYLANKIFSDNQIIRHQKAIAEIFNIDLEYFVEMEFSKEDKISDLRTAIEEFEYFSQLVYFCELAKVKHLCTNRIGFSQGDSVNIFICETPEFFEETGCENLTDEMMTSGADLFGFWAFNQIYSFFIPELDDSCTGFYGEEFGKNGLMDYAQESINGHIQHTRKQKFARLKSLIKAKVSFIYRPEILINYSY